MKSKVERYTVRQTPVRLIRMGQQRVEVLTAHLDDELRQKLCEAGGKASYIKGEPEVNDRNNLVYQMLTKRASFDKLIRKLINLVATVIEQFRGSLKTAAKRSKRSEQRRSKGSRDNSGYRYRALTT